MTLSKRSRKHGARRQRNKTTFTKSCTAMTWASMLLAVSGVTAFSLPVGRRTDVMKSRVKSTPGSLHKLNLSPLHSKDSIGPLAMLNSDQAGNQDSLSPEFVGSRCPSSTRRFATRLNYMDGDEHESEARRQETTRATEELQDKEAARWWQSVFSSDNIRSPPQEEDEQQVVDEYLEFLDKRYKRLHENEKVQAQPAPKKFSALGWLTADKSAESVSQQQEEDALYVLGVAELASERLLQKHHASLEQYKQKTPEEPEKEQEVVIDAFAEEETTDDVTALFDTDDSSQARKTLLFATLAQAGRNVLKGISARRKALIAYQEKKVFAAMLVAFKTALGAPIKATKLLWNLGGGKKTIGLTLSAFITAFLVVRPVAHAVVSEATNFSS